MLGYAQYSHNTRALLTSLRRWIIYGALFAAMSEQNAILLEK